MAKYIFFYNRSGHYNKLKNTGDELTVPISALTKFAEVEALDDQEFITKIWGISGSAWKTVGVVISEEIIARAPYYGDVVTKEKEDETFWVIDTNGVLLPCVVDAEYIADASVVNRPTLFSEIPGGMLPTPQEMNQVAAQEQVKRTARVKSEKENTPPSATKVK